MDLNHNWVEMNTTLLILDFKQKDICSKQNLTNLEAENKTAAFLTQSLT